MVQVEASCYNKNIYDEHQAGTKQSHKGKYH